MGEGARPASEGVGERIFLVRAACGDGPKHPMSMKEFAELLTSRSPTGRRYYDSTISLMENGQQRVTIDDVEVIAGVDPLHRGRAWLAWNDLPPGGASLPTCPIPSPA